MTVQDFGSRGVTKWLKVVWGICEKFESDEEWPNIKLFKTQRSKISKQVQLNLIDCRIFFFKSANLLILARFKMIPAPKIYIYNL